MSDRHHPIDPQPPIERHHPVDPPTPVDRHPDWDARYAEAEQVWSGRPNGALLAEAEGLTPGRALDVGCGEGADAVWLATQGWVVTALDVSTLALQRAQAAAVVAGVNVTWLHAGLLEAPLVAGGFDLVSVAYPALHRTPGQQAEHALLAAVAPAGTLLAVLHADMDVEQAKAHGFDPQDYVGHDQLTAVFDESWQVRTERRERSVHGGAGAQHTHDIVLRAHRLR